MNLQKIFWYFYRMQASSTTDILFSRSAREISGHIVSLADSAGCNEIMLLCDENSFRYCIPQFDIQSIASVFSFPQGEDQKSFDTVQKIIAFLLEHHATRKCMLVNLGGGVVSDLGGFAASIYKRGIPFINIPTTLLAMADASIGGKTGINCHGIKNLIGSFHFPAGVILYPGFLNTLPEREWKSGLGEVFKYALIGAGFSLYELDQLSPKEPDLLLRIINRCSEYKQAVALCDPFDKNERMILNFGHTVGHALESAALRSGISLSHGEAVAAGLLAETRLLEDSGCTLPVSSQETEGFYLQHFQPEKIAQLVPDQATGWLQHDKKGLLGKVQIPVPSPSSSVFHAVDFPLETLQNAIFELITSLRR
jgi:3-dehydroquinate synthase